MNAPSLPADVVAIVTGGSSGAGREIARALAGWDWPVVMVYLEHPRSVEATIAEIIAAGGTIVAVRADLDDDLDVERLFAESIALFGGVDVIVVTRTGSASLLYQHAARQLREGGAIVSVSAAERMAPSVARRLGERGITAGRAKPDAVVPFLDGWRRPRA